MNNDISKLIFKVTHAGGSGSCFYLKSVNMMVSNYHVVKGFRTVAVHDADRTPYLGRVVLVNPELDIALIDADHDFSYLPELKLAGDESLTIGARVRVGGYPFGMPFTITEGTASSPRQLMSGKYYIQIDAAVNPGNSGGPILNDDNEVVGITVSKFTGESADNMGFGIRVESLRKLLQSIEGIDRTRFNVQCAGCDELITEEDDAYCPNCGEELPKGVFDTRKLSRLGEFCEKAIERMGLNPVLARDGYESWTFHKGSSEINIYVYDGTVLFAESSINLLPKKDVEAVLDYILSTDMTPYKMGIIGREIYLCHRIHLADITEDTEERIINEIVGLADTADNLDNMMVDRFGCEFSTYSKPEA